MYKVIYYDINKHHCIYYNKKEAKLAEVYYKQKTEESYTPKSNFGFIALATPLISGSVIGKTVFSSSISPLFMLLIIHSLSLLTSNICFFLIKRYQSRKFDKHQIPFSKEKVDEIILKNPSNEKQMTLRFVLMLLLITAFMSVATYIIKTVFLAISTWLFSFLFFFFLLHYFLSVY